MHCFVSFGGGALQLLIQLVTLCHVFPGAGLERPMGTNPECRTHAFVVNEPNGLRFTVDGEMRVGRMSMRTTRRTRP
jgi:hypothetical protein